LNFAPKIGSEKACRQSIFYQFRKSNFRTGNYNSIGRHHPLSFTQAAYLAVTAIGPQVHAVDLERLEDDAFTNHSINQV
jgi:hypothetical protein